MLALESFRSIRFAWMHIISKLTGKSLNSFYYSLSYATFDHLRWASVTARLALSCIPLSLKGSAVFLSIDDTMVEKYGTIYLSVPLGYRLWTKQLSKLEPAADMVRSVMPEPGSCRQVILLCDSFRPGKAGKLPSVLMHGRAGRDRCPAGGTGR